MDTENKQVVARREGMGRGEKQMSEIEVTTFSCKINAAGMKCTMQGIQSVTGDISYQTYHGNHFEVYVLGRAQSFSHVRLFAIPWIVARQAPLSMGILQARILEWDAMPSARGSSKPRDLTQVSCIAEGFFTV